MGEPVEGYMRRALKLARRGVGRVSPNPMVGAVVVQEGRCVGEGYHLYSRKDHAEVIALREAGRKSLGADLYLTLEPCAHRGRTPPCVEKIVENGIRNVYVATLDPNPLVSGRGVRFLRKAGVNVTVGVCEAEAIRLNEVFFHYITEQRPFVRLKLAMTLDGKIATREGTSKWITGERSRREGHRLRYESDAILVGISTILRDDPSLNVRWRRGNSIIKIVLDSTLSTPPDARIFDSGDQVIIFHGSDVARSRQGSLGEKAIAIAVPKGEGGLDVMSVLEELGKRCISSLLVEGGSRVAASFVRGGHVNSVSLFYGSKLMGEDGLSGFGNLGVRSLDASPEVMNMRIRRLGKDFLVEGYLLQ